MSIPDRKFGRLDNDIRDAMGRGSYNITLANCNAIQQTPIIQNNHNNILKMWFVRKPKTRLLHDYIVILHTGTIKIIGSKGLLLLHNVGCCDLKLRKFDVIPVWFGQFNEIIPLAVINDKYHKAEAELYNSNLYWVSVKQSGLENIRLLFNYCITVIIVTFMLLMLNKLYCCCYKSESSQYYKLFRYIFKNN